jgi:hypothetical protein
MPRLSVKQGVMAFAYIKPNGEAGLWPVGAGETSGFPAAFRSWSQQC